MKHHVPRNIPLRQGWWRVTVGVMWFLDPRFQGWWEEALLYHRDGFRRYGSLPQMLEHAGLDPSSAPRLVVSV